MLYNIGLFWFLVQNKLQFIQSSTPHYLYSFERLIFLRFLHIWSFIKFSKFNNLALLQQLPQWCLCPWVHCLLLSQFLRLFSHQYWQHSAAFALESLSSSSCFRLQSVVGQCTSAMVFTSHFGNGVNFSAFSSLLALSEQVNGILITIRFKLDHAHNAICEGRPNNSKMLKYSHIYQHII